MSPIQAASFDPLLYARLGDRLTDEPDGAPTTPKEGPALGRPVAERATAAPSSSTSGRAGRMSLLSDSRR